MQLYARQGDLVFNKRAISGDLTKAPTLTLAGDDAPHNVVGEFEFRKDGLRTFLRIGEKGAEVTHGGRHKTVTLTAGDYEVYPLRERGDASDRAVED